jgi:uncharacterized protein (TIGR03118 family)
LAITTTNLYLANFGNKTVDVLDTSFVLQSSFPFTDASIPTNYAPFNIAYINGLIYVTYAQQNSVNPKLFVTGPGFGYVNIFTTGGILQQRLASNGPLNAPWGIITAPVGTNFPPGTILIGNFGDGTINIFNASGAFLGKVTDCNGVITYIDGLWGLVNGPSFSKTIYFASGPNLQANGLVGQLTQCTLCPC